MEEQTTATLSFGKNVDDIEQPPLLPEDWYVVEVREVPQVKANKAKLNDPEDEKAGNNWVVPVKTVTDEPEFNGRYFTLFFPLPRPGDDEKRTPQGMTVEDQCIERIGEFVKKFGGTVSGDEVQLGVGARGQVYVEQQVFGGEPRNSVNTFAGFKEADAGMSAVG